MYAEFLSVQNKFAAFSEITRKPKELPVPCPRFSSPRLSPFKPGSTNSSNKTTGHSVVLYAQQALRDTAGPLKNVTFAPHREE